MTVVSLLSLIFHFFSNPIKVAEFFNSFFLFCVHLKICSTLLCFEGFLCSSTFSVPPYLPSCTHTQEFASRLSFLQVRELFVLWGLKVITGSLLVTTLVWLSGQESLSFLKVHRWTLLFVTLYPWCGKWICHCHSLEKEDDDGFLCSLPLFLLIAFLFTVSEILITLFIFLFLLSSLLCNPIPHLHTGKWIFSFLCHFCEVCLALFDFFWVKWMIYLPFPFPFLFPLSLASKWIHFSLQAHILEFLFLIHSFIHSFSHFIYIHFSQISIKVKKDCFRKKGAFFPHDLPHISLNRLPSFPLVFPMPPTSNKRYKQQPQAIFSNHLSRWREGGGFLSG